MTLQDMRWLWAYYKGDRDATANKLEGLLQGNRKTFEGCGTEIDTQLHDYAWVFDDAEECFQAAKKVLASGLVERVRVAGYADKSDPDYHTIHVEISIEPNAHTAMKEDLGNGVIRYSSAEAV